MNDYNEVNTSGGYLRHASGIVASSMAGNEVRHIASSLRRGYMPRFNRDSIRAPTENDDLLSGYEEGSFWLNRLSGEAYMCSDARIGVAVWSSVTSSTSPNLTSSGGPGAQPQSNRTATADPTSTDDTDDGYVAGSYWINTVSDRAFFCSDPAAGAAVWLDLDRRTKTSSSGDGLQPQSNRNATVAPTVNDDEGDGYTVGSYWVNTQSDDVYICTGAGSGVANWVNVSEGSTELTSSSGNGLQPQSNRSATTDPGVDDDSSDGYVVGSYWVNTSNNNVFVCTDASDGAAVWTDVSFAGSLVTNTSPGQQPQSNRVATSDPTVTSDSVAGYAVGSYWVNLNTDRAYMCVDASPAAAVWSEITVAANGVVSSSSDGLQPQSNRSATTNPTASNDLNFGYEVGSYWVNTTTDKAFICVDNSSGAAVWLETTVPEAAVTPVVSSSTDGLQPQSNRAATTDPGVGDDTVDGYEVGSYWVNTTTDKAFICVDNSSGAAVWLDLTSSSGETDVSDTQVLYSDSGTIAGSSSLVFDGSSLHVPATIRPASGGGNLTVSGQADIALVGGAATGSSEGGAVTITSGAADTGTGGSVTISSGLATSGTNGDVSIVASSNDGSTDGHVYVSSQGVNYRWPAESTASQTFSVMMIQSGGEGSDPVLTFSRDVSLSDGVFAGDLDVGGTLDVNSNAVIDSDVVIGASASDASAMLTVTSTSKGLLPPRMTSTQRGNISSPADGLVVYDTTNERLMLRQDGEWRGLVTAPSTGLFIKQYYRNTDSSFITQGDKIEITNSNVVSGVDYLSYSAGVFSGFKENYVYRLTWVFNPHWTGSAANDYATLKFVYGDGTSFYGASNSMRTVIRRLSSQSVDAATTRVLIMETGDTVATTSHYAEINFHEQTATNTVKFTMGSGLLVEELGPKN